MNDHTHILILEDSPIDFALAKREINKVLENCVFRQEETPEGLLDALITFQPDIILSDFNMPLFDGMYALELTKKHQPLLPIIMWTGALNDEDAVKCMLAGASNYVLKDNIRRLGSAVVHALEEGRLALEHKKAEESLRHSEEQFRLIAENIPDLITLLDPQGNMIYNSPAYKSILGEHSYLNSADAFANVHPDDRKKVRGVFQEIVDNGANQLTDFRLLAWDGSVRYVESSGSAIRDANGAITQIIVVTRNVTEKKLIEEQLLRSQRMDSIGMLASGIAHDLNNTLTPIILSINMLRRISTNPQSNELLEIMDGAAKHGAAIVKQMLNFVRGSDSSKHIPVDINQMLSEIESLVHETFVNSISFRLTVPEDLPAITADPTQIQQVLMNLCINARDAMPSGGLIEINAETVTLDEDFCNAQPSASPGFYVAISIRDEGTGIPPEVLEHIFEPFFTTKQIGNGTGLGLTTVFTIVEKHRGCINVVSEVGKGTTFKIYLPAQESS